MLSVCPMQIFLQGPLRTTLSTPCAPPGPSAVKLSRAGVLRDVFEERRCVCVGPNSLCTKNGPTRFFPLRSPWSGGGGGGYPPPPVAYGHSGTSRGGLIPLHPGRLHPNSFQVCRKERPGWFGHHKCVRTRVFNRQQVPHCKNRTPDRNAPAPTDHTPNFLMICILLWSCPSSPFPPLFFNTNCQ